MTLSAWIRPTNASSRAAAVGMINGTSSNQYTSIGVETAAEGYDLQGVRRNVDFLTTEGTGTAATIANGSWHHVGMVNPSPGVSRLYLDRALVGQSTTTAAFPAGLNQVSIGGMRRSAGYIDKFLGDIDEVQIYNELLIPSQVLFLFNNPGGVAPPIAAGDVDLDGDVDVADLQLIANNFYTNVASRG